MGLVYESGNTLRYMIIVYHGYIHCYSITPITTMTDDDDDGDDDRTEQ